MKPGTADRLRKVALYLLPFAIGFALYYLFNYLIPSLP